MKPHKHEVDLLNVESYGSSLDKLYNKYGLCELG
jgi:hypothetical protein